MTYDEAEKISNMMRESEEYHREHKRNGVANSWVCPICTLKDLVDYNIGLSIR